MSHDLIRIKANPDYTASAVRLTNPATVAGLLGKLQFVERTLNEIEGKITDTLKLYGADLLMARQAASDKSVALIAELKAAIEQDGSYQDTERGAYGVKQRKATKEYHAEAFENRYPLLAPAVIIKAVNVQALNGLLKGGLVTEDGLNDGQITTVKESFAYIIKSGYVPEEGKK